MDKHDLISRAEAFQTVREIGGDALANALRTEIRLGRLNASAVSIKGRTYYPRALFTEWLESGAWKRRTEFPPDYLSIGAALARVAQEGIPERVFRFALASSEFTITYIRVNRSSYKCLPRNAFEEWIVKARQEFYARNSQRARVIDWARQNADYRAKTIEELACEYCQQDAEADRKAVERWLIIYANRNGLPVYRSASRLLAHLLEREALWTEPIEELAERYKLTSLEVQEVKMAAQSLERGRTWNGSSKSSER